MLNSSREFKFNEDDVSVQLDKKKLGIMTNRHRMNTCKTRVREKFENNFEMVTFHMGQTHITRGGRAVYSNLLRPYI